MQSLQLQDFSRASTHFSLSNGTMAMQKDGEQSLMIGLYSKMRLSILTNSRFSWAPLAMGLLVACNVRILGKASYQILQHADLLLNTACLVHSVALIALGFPVSGAIGLFGLSLIALKRHQLLPAYVDRYMILLGGIRDPLMAALHIREITDWLLRPIRSYLPESVKNPFHHRHVVEKNAFGERLSVNLTYVYADEVGQLLPPDYSGPLGAEALFDQLEALTTDKAGLQMIRECAITGRTPDRQPREIELFQKIIKALAQSILNDEVNREARVKELAELGHSCVEGWLRAVTVMLAPQTKRVEWAVHHLLANMRGEIVKEALLAYRLKHLGGCNNVHVSNNIQSALWHRFRTYEGELNMQLNPLTIIDSLYLRHVILDHNKSYLESLYMLAGCLGNIPEQIEPNVRAKISDVTLMVDRIQEAIGDRSIAWDSVLGWMAKQGIDLTEDYHGIPHLSKEGVRRLLWDMGILTSKESAPIEAIHEHHHVHGPCCNH